MANPNLNKDNSAAAPQFVRVTQQSGDTLTLEYDCENTVSTYLKHADIRVGQGETVTVNGRPSNLDQPVEPNSVIVVAGRVANG